MESIIAGKNFKYALDVENESGYGLIYVENNEYDEQLDFTVDLSVYTGYKLPASL